MADNRRAAFQHVHALVRHTLWIPTFQRRRTMPISARNQLQGKITEIILGDVMAHVTVEVGQSLIESVITRKSADELKLKKGDNVTVTVKATEVMIAKGD